MSAKQILILGGGISGLALAHRLCELKEDSKDSFQITLLEAKPSLGGVIETEMREGFLLEGGPDSFISEKPWAYELCKRIGLEKEVIGTREKHRRSFILQKGRLVPVPEGFYLMAPTNLSTFLLSPLLSWPGKLRAISEIGIPRSESEEDESAASFIGRRFGKELLEKIGQPMVGGIYTADLEKLSLDATLPKFRELECRYGSVLRGFWKEKKEEEAARASGPRYSLFLTLKGGMAALVAALSQRVSQSVKLRTSTRAEKIVRGSGWQVSLTTGEILQADILCLALPAPQASRLIHSFAPELAEDLAAIPYESVGTVNLAFKGIDPLTLTLSPQGRGKGEGMGFGFVVPASEKKSMVGCTFSSVKYSGRSPEDSVLIRAFFGGALHREVFHLSDAEIEQRIKRELREILGIQKPPFLISFHRYPESMPQYHVGHLGRVASLEKKLENYPGLFLTGNAFRGIGIPDCIHHAEQVAGTVLKGTHLTV